MKLLLENWREFLNENKTTISPRMTEVALNSMMAMSVFKDEEAVNEAPTAELNYIVSEASEPNSEVVQDFYDSLFAGERSGFLSPYSIDELSLMDLYLLDGTMLVSLLKMEMILLACITILICVVWATNL